MTDLTKSLLDAISIIANKSIDEISSDKTIKAVVKKVVSTSEGKYLVGCDEGDYFYAYNQSGSKDVYQVDEQIYILVPKDDMSQKKFIIGRVKNDEEDASSKKITSSLLNDYVIIGDNAVIENTYKEEDNIHVKRMQPLCLNSHAINDFYYCYLHNPIDDIEYNTINYPSVDIDEEMFFNSAKQAKALLLRAKFKADIDTSNIGNYGIIVNIAFADETNPQIDDEGNITYPPKLIAYVLDTNKMTGNPMKFYDYSSQYIISEFNGEKYLYIDSIVAFSEGFVDNSIEPHDENDDINIYIDNFEIIALDEVSAINGDYKLRLTAPLGNTVKTGKKDNLKIVATTTYLNQDITQNTVFYWGVKDPSVTFSHNNYHAKLGPGYRYINKDSRELELTPSELTAAENIFVCVAVYESDIVLKTLISLYNNNNKLNITIDSDQGTKFQFNEGNPTLTCLINGKTNNYQSNYSDDDFVFIWSKEDEDFGIILLSETESQLEANKQKELNECANNDSHLSDAGRSVNQVISYYSTRIAQIQDISYPDGIRKSRINCKLKNINNYVTYSCSVYRAGIYIGYASITLQNFKEVVNNNYYITITNGTQVFQYDEAGISPASQKQQEPIEVLNLTAVFHSPQGAEVTPRKVRWIVPQENTLINIPTLGLETDFETGERYYQGNIFPLSIKDAYDNTFNNNQLIAVVTHADGTEYRQSTNLLFTKIGEIGTNGTNTVVKINELGTVPVDEYLTIIKSVDITSINPTEEKYFYNARNENDLYISTNNPILEADLYTNNTQILGHTTKWTLADGSKTQGYLYNIRTDDENNDCVITCENDIKELDTRIVKAQTSLQGKYYYGFYSIPTIEYNENYNYENYPIKIMRNGTLKTVLYDSNGTNPSYNDSQGIHVELSDWKEVGYLEWTVESGAQTKQIINNETVISYNNPNILLSKNPKSKNGSKELKIDPFIENNEAYILEVQETGKNCAENAPVNIKKYIDDFLVDIEKIIIDNLLSVYRKKELLQNRLIIFQEKAPDDTNIYIKTVYNKYKELLDKIEQEYKACENKNKIFTEVYNSIQSIWKSEWPSIIVDTYTKSNANIDNIEQLIKKYQDAYDDRSNNDINNNIVEMPVRSETFKDSFITIINAIDNSYNTYINENELTSQFNSILIEYIKVLTAYISKIINDTKNLYIVSNNDENIDLYNIIKDKYNFIENNWNNQVGKYIYDILNASDENIANIFDKIRDLYQIYQSSYIGVKKYQVSENSELLNVWKAILNKEQIDLLKQIYVIPNETFNGLYMNNNVVGTAFIKDEYNNKIDIAKIYIPIIMTLNTYELAALNGWDGTSIEIGDDHIMTPQIGAGVKDDATNTFTGMVMGAINNNNDINNNFKSDKIDKIGLVGYSNGKQSIFIDSKTGKATFGLPEDNNTSSGEGRIELIPGGVSKIGNWKIGSHFLYNIVDGSYERRLDEDTRSGNKQKLMVPHDKHGIILSSDKPYIHIKGEIYKDTNLTGINYNDEYNNINPEDSLELRLDPSNNSLFSIVQHTSGFGDEENNLFFGYGLKNNNVIKSYDSNRNIGITGEYEGDVEYYIYNLLVDNDNNYKSYYIKQDDSNININLETNSFYKDFQKSNIANFSESGLDQNNFEKITGDYPVFIIDKKTGIIEYNPNNITWRNGITSFSDNNGYESITKETISFDDFQINLKYYNSIEESNNNWEEPRKRCTIGTLINNDNKSYYKIGIYYNYYLDLINMNLNNSINSYIKFKLMFGNQNILESNPISSIIYKNNYNLNKKQYVELFSTNEQKLLPNREYKLYLEFYTDGYTIDQDWFYNVGNQEILGDKKVPTSNLGSIKITFNEKNTKNFSTIPENCSISFENNAQYKWGGKFYLKNAPNSSYNFSFYVNTLEVYDFIVWRVGTNHPIGAGRTRLDNSNAVFVTNTWTPIDLLSDKPENLYWYSGATEENPWYINFYPLGTYVQSRENNGTEEYRLYNENITTMEEEIVYDIKWQQTAWDFNDAAFGISLKEFSIDSIFGLWIPELQDDFLLCVKAESADIQGIPFAKTYWENGNKKIKFYKEYYNWVNSHDNIKQYAYIDISQNNNINYKYIKTLIKTKVNNWFESKDLSINWEGINLNNNVYDSITGPINEDIKKAINWKEIIRVGLDESGRLFSSGFQDKKTYNQLGRILAFGKTSNLYGQEIKTYLSSSNVSSIIKIFTQTTNASTSKTTYITQGKNDNGNISIRTSEVNNYVELAASKVFDEGTNLAPTKINYVKVSYNGIQFQTNDDDNNLINSINLTKSKGVDIQAIKLFIKSNKIEYQIQNDFIKVITPDYVISSSKLFESSSTEDTYNNYEIKASCNEEDSLIRLKVGKESSINIHNNYISLEINKNKKLWIDTNDTSTGFFVDRMSLSFNSSDKNLKLQNNNNSYISILENSLSLCQSSAYIKISDKIEISGKNIDILNGPTNFSKPIRSKDTLYAYNDLCVGYNVDKPSDSITGAIRLYYKEKTQYSLNLNFVNLNGDALSTLYDWYNRRRWAIGVSGNSIFMTCVGGSYGAEGYFDDSSKRFYFNNTYPITEYTHLAAAYPLNQ